jgi:hypothetical protein
VNSIIELIRNIRQRTLEPLWVRVRRRAKAGARFGVMRVKRVRSALTFAGLLALVCIVLFSPLLLDDLAFRTSYLLRPSEDAVTFAEPVLISDQPRLTLLKGTLSVPPALSGKARTGEALAALVKGGSARLALKSAVLVFELTPQPLDDEATGLDQVLHGLVSPLLNALNDTAFETLMVRDTTVNIKSASGVFVLDDVNADVSVKRKTAMRVKGTAMFRGELLNFDTTLGTRIGRRGTARMPVKAQIIGNLFQATFDGRLDVGGALLLTAATEISIPNVRSVARWLGHPWPSGPGLKDFQTSGALEWSAKSIAMQKGTFKLDGNVAAGALSLTLGPVRPAIAGTLAFEAADLSVYAMPPVAQAAPFDAGSSLLAQFKGARDLTLPLSGLIDTDVRFSAEKITLGAILGQGAAASLTQHEGQLLLDVAEVSFAGGGRARGEVAINGWATTPNYAVRGQLENVELGDVSTVLAGLPMVRGRGTLDVDLKASGASGMDVLSKLSGRAGFTMPDGGTVSCSMKGIAAAAQAPKAGDANPCRLATPLAPFKASGVVTNGVLTIDQFNAVSGEDQMRMTGGVDLVTSVIDVGVSSRPVTTGEAAHEIVKVRGRPEAPTFAVQKPD